MMAEANEELCVRLYQNNQILVRCKVNYLGFSGINIDANPMLLPKGSDIDVVITAQLSNGEISCTLTSVVTTRSRLGVGLTFTGNNTNNYSVLQDILMHLNQYKAVG